MCIRDRHYSVDQNHNFDKSFKKGKNLSGYFKKCHYDFFMEDDFIAKQIKLEDQIFNMDEHNIDEILHFIKSNPQFHKENIRLIVENSSRYRFVNRSLYNKFSEIVGGEIKCFSDNNSLSKLFLADNLSELTAMEDQDPKNLIDLAAIYGAVNCFKYLKMNNCQIQISTLKWSVYGGNQEIIEMLLQEGYSFVDCIERAIETHRNDILDYFISIYEKQNFKISDKVCIEHYNTYAMMKYANIRDMHACETAIKITNFAISNYLLIKFYSLYKTELDNILARCVYWNYSFGYKMIIENGYKTKNAAIFHYACTSPENTEELVKYLIEKGFPIKSNSRSVISGFIQCLWNKKLKEAKVILNCVENIKQVHNEYEYPIITYLTKSIDNIELLQLMIEKGADVNETQLGSFPLVIAAQGGKYQVVKILLENGANPKTRYMGKSIDQITYNYETKKLIEKYIKDESE